MSSVYSLSEFQPSLCVDGITSNPGGGDTNLNICMSGIGVADPWLAVTLPDRSVVWDVIVYGRSDCCNELLQDFEVWVGDDVSAPSTAGGWHLCGRYS